jgi:hypothetical protein
MKLELFFSACNFRGGGLLLLAMCLATHAAEGLHSISYELKAPRARLSGELSLISIKASGDVVQVRMEKEGAQPLQFSRPLPPAWASKMTQAPLTGSGSISLNNSVGAQDILMEETVVLMFANESLTIKSTDSHLSKDTGMIVGRLRNVLFTALEVPSEPFDIREEINKHISRDRDFIETIQGNQPK